jgi:hypothetical protein
MKTLSRKPIVITLAILVVVLVWLAFRPELLFVSKSVDDPFPTTTRISSPAHP